MSQEKKTKKRQRESAKASKARMGLIYAELKREYPEVRCALNFKTPFQLLIATILSAQCTDERVNIVTESLFSKYPDPARLGALSQEELEREIHSTGFYKAKAKNILACCAKLFECHGGQVPQTMEELIALPGVGRKTANVVLGNAFGIASGITVDTHVIRLSNLLGFVETKDAVKIEQKLVTLVDQQEWTDFTHRLISHGRAVCIARRPKCTQCCIRELCPGATL